MNIWPMVAVALLVAGLMVVLVTVLACLTWLLSRRSEPRESITEAQARENAAPLTTAILPSDRRERHGLVTPLLDAFRGRFKELLRRPKLEERRRGLLSLSWAAVPPTPPTVRTASFAGGVAAPGFMRAR
jgi:hypothetical protein